MSWTQPAFAALAELVGSRTGLDFPESRRQNAELAMRRSMARTDCDDPGSYQNLVATNAAAFDDLVAELTVGETYFFRDPDQFEFIRRHIVPEMRRSRTAEQRVRVWSAGCASGEEAYSLAIVLAEEGVANILVGSDLSRAALSRARRGVYADWSLRGPGAAAARPYLERRDGANVVCQHIRERVSFQFLNLAVDIYPSFATGIWGLDLILCRNVLIYLKPQTVQLVAQRLFDSLAPGGWLITSPSDPPLQGQLPLETVVSSMGVFYRRPLGTTVARRSAGDPSVEVDETSATVAALPAAAAVSNLRDFVPTVHAEDVHHERETCAEVIAQVRGLANDSVEQAEVVCRQAGEHFPLNPELHYLHAVLLLSMGKDDAAEAALRRVLYLDRSLAVAHFTLGSLLWRRGDHLGAERAYRRAHDLCVARPADEIVPLSEGEHADRLATAAAYHLDILTRDVQQR
jgi:chemotaxis protein methyltransferase CheR